MSKVIVYGNWPVNTFCKVEYRNGQFWRGEIERGFEYFIADRPEIVEAYTNAGVTQVDTAMKPVSAEETLVQKTEVVEEESDEGDIKSLPWPTLKSRASKKAGYNVMTKQKALEILTE